MKKNSTSLYSILSILLFVISCSNPNPEKSIKNLKAAITGESNASSKYAAFAIKARDEGFDTIAKMFDATSRAEFIHATIHKVELTKLGFEFTATLDSIKLKTTPENLRAAIDGETYEFTTMYPDFIKVALEEKMYGADSTFNWAMNAEKKHKDFYQKALETITASSNENGLSITWAVCPKCGNTFEEGSIDEICSFCKSPKIIFLTF